MGNQDSTRCICKTGFYNLSMDIDNTLPCYVKPIVLTSYFKLLLSAIAIHLFFCSALLKLSEKPKHICNKTSEVTITWNMSEKTQSLDEAIFHFNDVLAYRTRL